MKYLDRSAEKSNIPWVLCESIVRFGAPTLSNGVLPLRLMPFQALSLCKKLWTRAKRSDCFALLRVEQLNRFRFQILDDFCKSPIRTKPVSALFSFDSQLLFMLIQLVRAIVYLSLDTQRLITVTIATAERAGQCFDNKWCLSLSQATCWSWWR